MCQWFVSYSGLPSNYVFCGTCDGQFVLYKKINQQEANSRNDDAAFGLEILPMLCDDSLIDFIKYSSFDSVFGWNWQ